MTDENIMPVKIDLYSFPIIEINQNTDRQVNFLNNINTKIRPEISWRWNTLNF